MEDPFDLIWYEGARVDFMVKQAVAGARANLIEEVADMVADARYKIDAKDNEVSATVCLSCLSCLSCLNGSVGWCLIKLLVQGVTVLIAATGAGNLSLMRLLLRQHADPNVADDNVHHPLSL